VTGVVIRADQDDSIGASQIQTQPADPVSQQEEFSGGVVVEVCAQLFAVLHRRLSVHPVIIHEGYPVGSLRGQEVLQKVQLDEVLGKHQSKTAARRSNKHNNSLTLSRFCSPPL
jgi:hypothetical protein